MILEGLGLLAVLGGAAALYRKFKTNSVVNTVAAKGTAFARVAEQEGKLIALKAAAEVKKAAAVEAHKALDEIDALLG
jgi:hypothetical protein